MTIFLNIIYFAIIIHYALKFLRTTDSIEMAIPFTDKSQQMWCTGLEALLILLFATGLMGFLPILAFHLAFVEIICIFAIQRAPYNAIYSFPVKIFIIFLLWIIIGIFYTPQPIYGIRMLLKYAAPLFMALFASAVIRDFEVVLKSCLWGRWIALLSFIVQYIPMQGFLFQGVFWNRAALATNYIIWTIFSLSLFYIGIERKKNLFYTIGFILPCFLWVFRTDIFGTVIALSAFFFIKYRMKSAPLIAVMAVLAVCALFYIPSVKSKMYFHPDEVTMEDFITGNVDENNVNTSGRKPVWEDMENFYYKGHEIAGSGTGRVQTYFYEEAVGWRKGGQLHNDLLVLKCDNGLIGLSLFLLTYLAILLHCVRIYHKSDSWDVKTCILMAGASLIGILVTTYSDNTVSYSLATLSYPWALYGMALGLREREKELLL